MTSIEQLVAEIHQIKKISSLGYADNFSAAIEQEVKTRNFRHPMQIYLWSYAMRMLLDILILAKSTQNVK